MSNNKAKMLGALVLILFSCSGAHRSEMRLPQVYADDLGVVAAYKSVGGVSLGEPLGITVDFEGNVFLADGLPGRIIFFNSLGTLGLEFQEPTESPGFYPSDLKLKGFFVYVVDEVNRMILRFDKDGAYRDILINFNEQVAGRRASPSGMDVDQSGRIAVTDVENHRILIFDAYLSLEMAFGSYGSFPGQFDSPQGVSFTDKGEIVVADTGNKRIEIFDSGGKFVKLIPPENKSNPLQNPRRVEVDEKGRFYVADPEAGAVFLFSADGKLIKGLRPKDSISFEPTDVTLSKKRRLYVTDAASRSLFICRVMSY